MAFTFSRSTHFKLLFDDIALVEIWHPFSVISLIVNVVLLLIGLIHIKSKSPLVLGILIYFITISIFSNFILQLGNAFGERLVFTPSLGFCIVLATLFYQLIKWGEGQSTYTVRGVLPIALLSSLFALYSVKTIDRNLDWKSNSTLVEADLKTSPRSHVLTTMKVQAEFAEAGDDKEKIRATLPLFARALELNPKGTDRYGNYGFAYYKVNEYESAIPLMERALEIRPEITDYQLILALCYAHTNQNKKADSIATNLLSNSGYVRQLELTYELSKIAFEQLSFERAVQYGRIALPFAKSEPDRGKVLIHLGNIFFKTKQFPEAYEYYQQTIAFDKNNTNLLNRTANIAIELNRLAEALNYLNLSHGINQEVSETYALFYKIYQKTGDTNLADLHLQKFNQLSSAGK